MLVEEWNPFSVAEGNLGCGNDEEMAMRNVRVYVNAQDCDDWHLIIGETESAGCRQGRISSQLCIEMLLPSFR